jgi:hypothetical protein
VSDEPEIRRGLVAPAVAAEHPGLWLAGTEVAATAGPTPRELRERLRRMADRVHGAEAIAMRAREVPHAYRVFFRHVGLDHLVRQALRMRPDRIVVGEVRGSEMVSLLAALNTGHEGGCGTLHANSADDVPIRLEALGIAAGLRRDAVHAQAGAALDVVVHLVRDQSGHRRLAEIDLLSRSSTGWVQTQRAFTADSDAAVHIGPGHAALTERLAARGWTP